MKRKKNFREPKKNSSVEHQEEDLVSRDLDQRLTEKHTVVSCRPDITRPRAKPTERTFC